MPAPAPNTTAAAAPSSSSLPPPTPAAGTGTFRSSSSSARISYHTLRLKKGPKRKRKRKLMAKGDRQNKKNWAEGVREEIMLAHLPKYTEELAKGGKAAAEYAVKVCHELNYKVPYYLADDEEPDTIPEYDHENPPPLPKLPDEEERKRAAALLIRNKRVVNWLKYRARKVVPATPKGSRDFNNAFALWMMRLTGTSGAPKKARQGWQQYQHENSEFVQDSAQRAWDAKRANKAAGGGEADGADGSEEEGDAVSDGKKKQKGVGFTSKHARELFNRLPANERRALLERAKAEKEAEKALWEEAINAPPSRKPEDVQAARNALPSFLNPILDGINQNAGDAHVLVLIGGREPKKGGIVTVQHYDVGTNKQDLHFSEWDNRRFRRDVLGLFGEYLSTVWDDDECAKMALEGPLEEEEPEEDIMGDAPYRFDSEVIGGDLGASNGDGEGGEWDDEEEGGGGNEEDEVDGGGEQVGGGGGERDDDEGEDGGSAADRDTEDVEDDVEQPPSKRQRFGDGVLLDAERGLPAATPIAGGADEQRVHPPASKPPRPRPRPTRASTRKGGATAHSTPSSSTSIGVNLVAGIPIDPELLRSSCMQGVNPAVEGGTPSTSGSLHVAAIESAPAHARSPRAASAPSPLPRMDATIPRAPSPLHAPSAVTPAVPAPTNSANHPTTSETTTSLDPCEDDLVAVFPDVPDDAAAWFVNAMKVLRVELGGEWIRLLRVWTRYEDRRNYGQDLPAKRSRLDGAKSRPKEVSTWIAGGRWRSPGCEPVKKAGKFASALMSAWWAWYVMLVPDWREEDENGRLDDFDRFGDGMGKLDVPGVNGMLSLIVCLKWVGEALISDTDVHDRAGVNRDWRRAITDLAKMLEVSETVA